MSQCQFHQLTLVGVSLLYLTLLENWLLQRRKWRKIILSTGVTPGRVKNLLATFNDMFQHHSQIWYNDTMISNDLWPTTLTFITLSVHFCIQHGAHDAARRAGPSSTAWYSWIQGKGSRPTPLSSAQGLRTFLKLFGTSRLTRLRPIHFLRTWKVLENRRGPWKFCNLM